MNQFKKHQRPHDENQQIGKATRPQLPRDGSSHGMNHTEPGNLPKGGYTSVWNFNGNTDTKKSPTSGGGRKVY